MFYINKLMKVVLANKDIIENVCTFEKVSDNKVFGVEIRLKWGMTTLRLEDDYIHINPFTKAQGYVYLAVGSRSDFNEYVQQRVEGIACTKLIREFPQILEGGMWTTDHRDEIDKRKKEIVNEVRVNHGLKP
jgi:hypothetical protein